MTLSIIYDNEIYPNVFTLAAEHSEYPMRWQFEISPWRNDSKAIIEFCYWIKQQGGRMVGFNNIGFDYPLLHLLIQGQGKVTPQQLYDKAQAIISSMDGPNRWSHMAYPSDRFVEQLDLYKIHHFDNSARSTSLKVLEFNMRMDDVSDLPFPVGATLTQEQVVVLHEYNAHDVTATKRFYHETIPMIEFREGLTKTHERDFMNHADVKIGKEIMELELSKVGVDCYKYGPKGREPKQTRRDSIKLSDCILPWIELENIEFRRVLDWFRQQTITETKGVFKDLIAHTYGLDFVFGTGGLHASVENRAIITTGERLIESRDVSSYYPNLAIVNKFYPEHLGEKFCTAYEGVYKQRKSHAKGTVQNAAFKLALNGTYGASNDQFSVFYDPMFTLKITLNGQLLLCLLIENLCKVPTVEMVMTNTDGIEYTIHPDYVDEANAVCTWWCAKTGLVLEGARYAKMFIRDCNSYIAVYED